MGRIIYSDGRTALTTTAFRYKLTDSAGTLVKDWTTGATWTEEPAGTYYLDDAAAVPGTRYAVEPATGEVGGAGMVPYTDVATAKALAEVDTVVDGIAADYAKTGEAAAEITGIPASVDIRLSETHGGGSWESNQPTTGALVTQLSVGDDDLPLGRIMPYGTISVYLGAELHYRFDEIADADGDFVLTLPYGSTWTLVAENPPNYRSTTAVITIPPLP